MGIEPWPRSIALTHTSIDLCGVQQVLGQALLQGKMTVILGLTHDGTERHIRESIQ